MTTDVGSILTSGQRARLLSMKQTSRQIDDASVRLASSQKVNSALDNPGSFFLSRSLRNKAADLSRLLDGIGQNVRVIEQADHGISASLKVLDQAENYLEDVRQKFLNNEVTIEEDNAGAVTFSSTADFLLYDQAQSSVNTGTVTLSGDTEVTLSGNLWLKVAFNYNVTANTYVEFDFQSTYEPEIGALAFEQDNNFANDNRRIFLYGTQQVGVSYSAPIPTYEYSGSGTWETYQIHIGQYFQRNITHLAFIQDDDLAPYGNTSYRNIIFSEGPYVPTVTIADDFETDYARILHQMDLLAVDADYRGVNLLAGDDMTTYFNADGSSKLVTQGIDATLEGLGLDLTDFTSIDKVEEKLQQVKEARETLRQYGLSIANDLSVLKTRDDFTRGKINVSNSGASDLVDANLNEEGANLLALQTRQQIQVNVLQFRNISILSLLA